MQRRCFSFRASVQLSTPIPHPFLSTQHGPEKGEKDPFSGAELFKDFLFDDRECTLGVVEKEIFEQLGC